MYDELFIKRAFEFAKEEGLYKFVIEFPLRFSDGTSMSSWFYNNEIMISNSKNKTLKNINKQYEKYKVFKNREMEFCKESNKDKFKTDGLTKFKNGQYMGRWFIRYKNTIQRLTDSTSREICKQYEEYKAGFKLTPEKKEAIFEERLQEFLNITSLDKFNPYSSIRFKDKTYIKSWFSIDRLEEYKGEEHDKIISQYNEYKKMMKERLEKKRNNIFMKKRLEFANEMDLNKFKRSNNIRFKSGTIMSSWFSINKDRILQMDDDVARVIIAQYDSYKSGKVKFYDSLEETFNKKA